MDIAHVGLVAGRVLFAVLSLVHCWRTIADADNSVLPLALFSENRQPRRQSLDPLTGKEYKSESQLRTGNGAMCNVNVLLKTLIPEDADDVMFCGHSDMPTPVCSPFLMIQIVDRRCFQVHPKNYNATTEQVCKLV